MKTQITIAAFAVISAMSCKKDNDSFTAPTPVVTKIVNISIQQARDYSDEQFNGVQAQLKLAIAKVKKADGGTIVLWDSTVAFKSLRDYPRTYAPFSVSKSFSGLDDNTESLQASYTIQYKDAQNQLSTKGKNEFANFGASVLTLPVRL